MAVDENFDSWLTQKLESLNIDDEILGSYINSVVTSDDSDVDKIDNLKDILLGVTQDVDIDLLCCEVLNKWSEYHKKTSPDKEKITENDIAFKVARIMEKQAQPVLKVANRTLEEEKLREAILSRCSYVSSSEEEEDSEESTLPANYAQNQNVEAVFQAEKERREKMKSEAEKKKVQDKINLEKQKEKQDERKEKEKKRTQKREHKR